MNKKKKLAFYGIKYFPAKGGTSRVAENLIYNLSNHFDITIYCYKNKYAKSHIPGVKTIEIPEFKLGSLGVFFFFFLSYIHVRWFGHYDIVHAHKIDSFFFLKGLARKTKVVATAHEAPYKRDKWGTIAKVFFKLNEKRFLSFEGTKTAISEPLCDYYKEKHNTEILFIPNGINIEDTYDEVSLDKFWPQELPKNTPFVFFAARRIMGTKGLHTMLEAYKKIEYKGAILIAGELDNYPNYIKKVKKLSEGLKVYFLGFVNPLPTLLAFVNKCDYFVFPSETEGMSIMLLEVASVGKPIIASDIPENTQVFGQEEVLYFKNKDADDLSEKILWAANNYYELLDMGNAAKTKVSSKYTWSRIAKEYISVYKNLA